MAFNLAGAAQGSTDALHELIKLDLAKRQQAEMSEYRKLQQQVAQQNAESLAEERQARVDAARQKQLAIAQRRQWAESVASQEGPPNPNDPMDAYRRARAAHILETGEDVPDAVVTSYLKAPEKRTPELLTPEEVEQQIKLDEAKKRNTARFRAPRAASAASLLRQERQDGNIAIQNYLVDLRRRHGKDAASALKEFDESGNVERKGRGLVDIGQARRLLERSYGLPSTPYTPKQQVQNRLYNDVLADMIKAEAAAAAAAGNDDDDDLSGR